MDLIQSYLDLYILNPYRPTKETTYMFWCREEENPYCSQYMEITGIFQYYYGPLDFRCLVSKEYDRQNACWTNIQVSIF